MLAGVAEDDLGVAQVRIFVNERLIHKQDTRGIAVALLHPGMVATDMTGGTGVPVGESAAGLIARIDELDVANTGGFWHANGERLPW